MRWEENKVEVLNKIRWLFVTVFTALNTFLGAMAGPFYILLAANITDYITGVYASACRGEKISSDKGARGIAKKICMWLLVLIGFALDYCIMIATQTMEIVIGFKCLVSVAVIFWLLANELISILENIHDIGVPLPPFLMKLAQYLKEKTEDITEDVTPGIHDT